jgi:Protein of unknown function (DUF3224)
MRDAHIIQGVSDMTKHTKGEFEVTGWDEDTYEKLGGKGKLTRAHIGQDYTGDLVAKGTWDLLMCYLADGTAVYAGLGRVEGKLGDRKGSFVMESHGTYDGKAATSTWAVIPGSATGSLKGLSGKGVSVAPMGSTGSYDLDLV